uniref:Voltage-dependent anion-selective channel n=1 Tax=Rhabditophanes sp. KR3021 TaxID=114890 RepID=A0AC35TKM7_9BILA
MAPPTYDELLKPRNDLFNKGYNISILKVDCTSVAGPKSEFDFKTTAAQNMETPQTFDSNFESKFHVKSLGLTLTEKWTSKNVAISSLEIKNVITEGLKVSVEDAYSLESTKHKANAKLDYACPSLRFNTFFDVGSEILNSSVVYNRGKHYVGVQSLVNLRTSEVETTNATLSTGTRDYSLTGFINNGSQFGVSVIQRPTKNITFGTQINWKQDKNPLSYGFATKYEASSKLIVRAKIDNTSEVAFSATARVNRNLALTASIKRSLLSVNAGKPKYGFGVDYSA